MAIVALISHKGERRNTVMLICAGSYQGKPVLDGQILQPAGFRMTRRLVGFRMTEANWATRLLQENLRNDEIGVPSPQSSPTKGRGEIATAIVAANRRA